MTAYVDRTLNPHDSAFPVFRIQKDDPRNKILHSVQAAEMFAKDSEARVGQTAETDQGPVTGGYCPSATEGPNQLLRN